MLNTSNSPSFAFVEFGIEIGVGWILFNHSFNFWFNILHFFVPNRLHMLSYSPHSMIRCKIFFFLFFFLWRNPDRIYSIYYSSSLITDSTFGLTFKFFAGIIFNIQCFRSPWFYILMHRSLLLRDFPFCDRLMKIPPLQWHLKFLLFLHFSIFFQILQRLAFYRPIDCSSDRPMHTDAIPVFCLVFIEVFSIISLFQVLYRSILILRLCLKRLFTLKWYAFNP